MGEDFDFCHFIGADLVLWNVGVVLWDVGVVYYFRGVGEFGLLL